MVLNDLPAFISNGADRILFADDTTFVIGDDSSEDLELKIKDTLDYVGSWFNERFLY